MEIEIRTGLSPEKETLWLGFLKDRGLFPEEIPETVFFLWENGTLLGTASLSGDLIRHFAVDPAHRGEDLSARLLTAIRSFAFERNVPRLYLLTKPENERVFRSLLFEPVAETPSAVFMESPGGGLSELLSPFSSLPKGKNGVIVLNADPFTLGHRALIEKAAALCDAVFVFVLSEEKGRFSASDRLSMVKAGIADLPHVFVLPTGRYLVSAATFPTYFLKDKADGQKAACELDIAVFSQKIAPALGITVRFLGSEPFDPVTAQYNEALQKELPKSGVSVSVIPRAEKDGKPISAKTVRALLDQNDLSAAFSLLPESTAAYLKTLLSD